MTKEMSERLSAAEIKCALAQIAPGDAMYFPCQGQQPFNRMFYQRVNGVAYRLWGAGGYKMLTGIGKVGVMRTAQPQ